MTDVIHFAIIAIFVCEVAGMAGSTLEDMVKDLARRFRGLT